MIGKEDLWISIVFSLLAIIFFTYGAGLLAIFVNKFNAEGLVIAENYIEIPGRWKDRTKLKFEEIENIGELETYDYVIEIVTETGIYLIEKKWMKSKEFDKVREKLIDWTNKNYTQQRL